MARQTRPILQIDKQGIRFHVENNPLGVLFAGSNSQRIALASPGIE